MIGPRTFIIEKLYESEIHVSVYKANYGFIHMRDQFRRWMGRIEKRKLKADTSQWQIHPTTQDPKFVRQLGVKHGAYDFILLPLHFYGTLRFQKSLDSYIKDVLSHSITAGEVVHWSPGAVLFAVPRRKEFAILKQQGLLLAERSVILKNDENTPLVVKAKGIHKLKINFSFHDK